MKNVKRKSRGQTSTEFVVLTTFMLLVFLAFLVIIQSKTTDSIKEKNDFLAQNIMDDVVNEVRLAESVTDDYSRTFTLPYFLENGIPYDIKITGYDTGGGEIVISYEGVEKIQFLDEQISQFSSIGKGKNQIQKKNGLITIKYMS